MWKIHCMAIRVYTCFIIYGMNSYFHEFELSIVFNHGNFSFQLHCKDDPYFYGKGLLDVHRSHVRQSCNAFVLATNLKRPWHRYLTRLSHTCLCPWHVSVSQTCHKTKPPEPPAVLIYRLAGGSVYYKYVEDMSNLT